MNAQRICGMLLVCVSLAACDDKSQPQTSVSKPSGEARAPETVSQLPSTPPLAEQRPAAPPAAPPQSTVSEAPAAPALPRDTTEEDDNRAASSIPTQTLRSSDGTYAVEYRTSPTPIPTNQPFTISVRVMDGADSSKTLNDVTLDVDAAMPEHGHGMNRQPKVASRGDGSFEVAGMLFHMPGRWELYFDITRDGQTERAQTEIILE